MQIIRSKKFLQIDLQLPKFSSTIEVTQLQFFPMERAHNCKSFP